MQMTDEEIASWVEAGLPARAASLVPLIRRRGAKPFAHPRDWAGFYIQGDV
jgi:hypothetical protein